MESNTSEFKENVTLDQVIDYFNLNVTSINDSEVAQTHLFDLYEAYRTIEKEQLSVYKSVAYVLGTLIILSNLTVVISSGLILKKGQQPKSTYLLLGNVSLADTIIGFSIIFGVTVDNSVSSNPLCIFQIGMLVCPAMVSIFSVGLIAVDRYIYILHGLYYQRWFNTTRVRIGIVIIWIIGITLGFIPATGWTNKELRFTRCDYVALFPGAVILLNSLLSSMPVILVVVLYSIILVKALKTVNNINLGAKNVTNMKVDDNSQLRIYRGPTIHDKSNNLQSTNTEILKTPNLCRSASFHSPIDKKKNTSNAIVSVRSNSADNVTDSNVTTSNEDRQRIAKNSSLSVDTEYSHTSSSSVADIKHVDVNNTANTMKIKIGTRKTKEPNKWRAITVVMLTSGLFVSCLPAMGWTGRTFTDYRCWYVAVFPPALLIVLSIVVLSVIIIVCILYLLILRRAVQTVDKIREFKESSGYTNKAFNDDVSNMSTTGSVVNVIGMLQLDEKKFNIDLNDSNGGRSRVNISCCRPKAANHPSKLKAVKTVLLVTLCFVGTWAPYYVAVIMFVKCDLMKNGYECIPLEVLTLGPLYLLGACNSLCDPLIYAWRHTGFKTNLWKIYWKYTRSRL